MNTYDDSYKNLINFITRTGRIKSDRTGVGTKSVFGYEMRVNMTEGFPLLTIKNTHWKSILHELLWMLDFVPDEYKYNKEHNNGGCTNIKYLVDNNVKIWNDWPYKEALKDFPDLSMEDYVNKIRNDHEYFTNPNDSWARKYGNLGPVYGIQWRYWKNGDSYIDQFENMVNKILSNPDDRRNIITAWNPSVVDQQILPPCHHIYQVWTCDMSEDERKVYAVKNNINIENAPYKWISMKFQMRSVDCILGLPMDVASYAIQLKILGELTNTVPYELIASLGDTHIYLNHLDKVDLINERIPNALPELKILPIKSISDINFSTFELINYNPNPAIKFQIAV